jgi:hypothetical protein
MDPDDIHGMHVAPVQKHHVVIEWSPTTARCGRIRVRSYTCPCASTWYELCTAGGLAHIRRSTRSRESIAIAESAWLPTAETRRLWEKLLMGLAR